VPCPIASSYRAWRPTCASRRCTAAASRSTSLSRACGSGTRGPAWSLADALRGPASGDSGKGGRLSTCAKQARTCRLVKIDRTWCRPAHAHGGAVGGRDDGATLPTAPRARHAGGARVASHAATARRPADRRPSGGGGQRPCLSILGLDGYGWALDCLPSTSSPVRPPRSPALTNLASAAAVCRPGGQPIGGTGGGGTRSGGWHRG